MNADPITRMFIWLILLLLLSLLPAATSLVTRIYTASSSSSCIITNQSPSLLMCERRVTAGLLWPLLLLHAAKPQGDSASWMDESPIATSIDKDDDDDVIKDNNNNNNAYYYVQHWQNLLQMEYQQAVQELRDKRNTWSKQALEMAGITLHNVLAEPESDLFGEKIVRIILGPGQYHHQMNSIIRLKDKFSRGDVLVLTPPVSNDSRTMMHGGFRGTRRRRQQQQQQQSVVAIPKECCVVDVGDDWMTVSVGPSWPAGLWEARRVPGAYRVRLDRTASRTPYKAQQVALELTRKGQAGDIVTLLADLFCCCVSNNHDDEDDDETIAETQRLPLWLEKKLESSSSIEESIQQAISEAATTFQPNPFQKEAIAWALQRQISLIQGPPGTGKTRIAALLIATALQIQDQSSPRILAVAHSNGAADVLLQALLDMGVPAIRAGRPATVAPNVRHRTVIAMAEKHPEVVALREKARDMSLPSHERSAAILEINQCKQQVCQAMTETAPVVVASCIGAHQLLATGGGDTSFSSFPLVVVDEAAQTTEPALICALATAKAQQVVLVGDTRQLPPTVASETAEIRNELGLSPMARLEKRGVPQKTLREQYRMPPALLEFPSQHFYNGLVMCAAAADGMTAKHLSPPRGFPWPVGLPLAFINVGGRNNEISHSFGGRSNPAEARLVVDVVSMILQAGDIEPHGIAVISPYSKQVQLVRSELSWKGKGDVRVGTVDSFQGQEVDVVIFSAVRSNPLAEMGFLRDPRRLCVAITRSRRGLVVVGDKSVLCSSHHWAALIDSYQQRECIYDAVELDSLLPTTVAGMKTNVEEDASSEWDDLLADYFV